MHKRKVVSLVVLMLLVAVAGPTVVLAQADDPTDVQVVVVRVKFDMVDEFESLQKELAAATKKAGGGPRNIWEVARGPYRQYHIVSPMGKFASLDEPAEPVMEPAAWAAWLRRVWRCTADREVRTARQYGDRSIPVKEGRTPKLAVVSFRTNAPGMGPAYGRYLRDELIPAYKKVGMDGVIVYRNRFGGSGRSWAVVYLVDKWADFDGPGPRTMLSKSLGEEKAGELLSKGGKMIVAAETLVLRHRPELSVAGTM